MLILSITIVQAQTGTFDASFGVSGKVHVFPTIRDMALQKDGKIVTINALDGVDYDYRLFRYKMDGSPDSSFGKWGNVIKNS